MFLKRKDESETDGPVELPDPKALIASQSLRGAVVGGIAAIVIMCALWTSLTVATGRVFPWFTMLQGVLIGGFVRRYGRGFDYRFPVVAALLACAGALVGNLIVALPETMRQLDAGAVEVLRGLTWRSFELFFDEVITVVDYIYAGFAAALAAFYSRRRLNRHEEFVLRSMNAENGE